MLGIVFGPMAASARADAARRAAAQTSKSERDSKPRPRCPAAPPELACLSAAPVAGKSLQNECPAGFSATLCGSDRPAALRPNSNSEEPGRPLVAGRLHQPAYRALAPPVCAGI